MSYSEIDVIDIATQKVVQRISFAIKYALSNYQGREDRYVQTCGCTASTWWT